MADDVKADDLVDQLRDQFSTQIRNTFRDVPAVEALQLAATLCDVQREMLAGLRVTYKARPAIDGDAITESWRRGLTLKDIMKAHGCSRAAAYKYHPNQQERPARRA